jgi:hypothetical protein
MAALLKELETQALQLSPQERGELTIAQAWDEEIARRVADMDAGRTEWIPADEVMARLRDKIATARNDAGQP